MSPPSTMLSCVVALTLPLLCCAGSGWHQRTVRMTIKNVKNGEYLFASQTSLDASRRHVLTWVPGFDARRDPSGQWDVTFMPGGRVTIWNVKYREPMYAGHDKLLDRKRRRVLTWRRTSQYLHHPWEIRFIRPNVATLRSAQFGEYLFAGVKKLDLWRRYALTWVPGFDPWKDATGQWLMEAVHHGHASGLEELVSESIAMAGNGTGILEDFANQTIPAAGEEVASPAEEEHHSDVPILP